MKRYYVCRSYSHTDRNHLIKIISRGFKDKLSADDWQHFEQKTTKNKKFKFFVIESELEYIP